MFFLEDITFRIIWSGDTSQMTQTLKTEMHQSMEIIHQQHRISLEKRHQALQDFAEQRAHQEYFEQLWHRLVHERGYILVKQVPLPKLESSIEMAVRFPDGSKTEIGGVPKRYGYLSYDERGPDQPRYEKEGHILISGQLWYGTNRNTGAKTMMNLDELQLTTHTQKTLHAIFKSEGFFDDNTNYDMIVDSDDDDGEDDTYKRSKNKKGYKPAMDEFTHPHQLVALKEQEKIMRYYVNDDESMNRSVDRVKQRGLSSLASKWEKLETIVKLVCRCILNVEDPNSRPVYLRNDGWAMQHRGSNDMDASMKNWIRCFNERYILLGREMMKTMIVNGAGNIEPTWTITSLQNITYKRVIRRFANHISLTDATSIREMMFIVHSADNGDEVNGIMCPSIILEEPPFTYVENNGADGTVTRYVMAGNLPHPKANMLEYVNLDDRRLYLLWLSDVFHTAMNDPMQRIGWGVLFRDNFQQEDAMTLYRKSTLQNFIAFVEDNVFNVNDGAVPNEVDAYIRMVGTYFNKDEENVFVIVKMDTMIIENPSIEFTRNIILEWKGGRLRRDPEDINIICIKYAQREAIAQYRCNGIDNSIADVNADNIITRLRLPVISNVFFSDKSHRSPDSIIDMLQNWSNVLHEDKEFETRVWNDVKLILTARGAVTSTYDLIMKDDQEFVPGRGVIDMKSDKHTWVIGNEATEFAEALNVVCSFLMFLESIQV